MGSIKTCENCNGKGRIHTADTLAHEDDNCMWCDDCFICKGKGTIEIDKVPVELYIEPPTANNSSTSVQESVLQTERPVSVVISQTVEETSIVVSEKHDTKHDKDVSDTAQSSQNSEFVIEIERKVSSVKLEPLDLGSADTSVNSANIPNSAEENAEKPYKVISRNRTNSISSQSSSRGSVRTKRSSLFQTLMRRGNDNESKLSLGNSDFFSIEELNSDDTAMFSSPTSVITKEHLEEWYIRIVKIQKKREAENEEQDLGSNETENEITIASLVGTDNQDSLNIFSSNGRNFTRALYGPVVQHETLKRARLQSVQPRQSLVASLGTIPKHYLIPHPNDRKMPSNVLADFESDGITISKLYSIREADFLEHVFNPFFIDSKSDEMLLMSYRYFMDPKKLFDYVLSFIRCIPKLEASADNSLHATVSGKIPLKKMESSSSAVSAKSPTSPLSSSSSASIQQRKKLEKEEKEKAEYFAKQVIAIRSRAFKFLVKWVQNYWHDFFNDTILLGRIEKFGEDLAEGKPLDGLSEDEIFYAEGVQLVEAIRHQKMEFAEDALFYMKNFTLNKNRKDCNGIKKAFVDNAKNQENVDKLVAGFLDDIRKYYKQNCTFLFNFDFQKLAEILTLLEFDLFKRIPLSAYLDLVRAVGKKQKTSSMRPILFHLKDICDQNQHSLRQLMEYLSFWNTLSDFVSTSILCYPVSANERGSLIKKWIKIAQTCRFLNNYGSMAAIVKALMSPNIFQLNYSWSHIKKKYFLVLKEMASLLELDLSVRYGKFEVYMNEVKCVSPPTVPFLATFLRELERIYLNSADLERVESHVGLQKNVEYVVNVEKFSSIYQIYTLLSQARQTSYRSYANQMAVQNVPTPLSKGYTLRRDRSSFRYPSNLASPRNEVNRPYRSPSGTSFVNVPTTAQPNSSKRPLERNSSSSLSLFASRNSSTTSMSSLASNDLININGYITQSSIKEIDEKSELEFVRTALSQLLQCYPVLDENQDSDQLCLTELAQCSASFSVIRTAETYKFLSKIIKKKEKELHAKVRETKTEETTEKRSRSTISARRSYVETHIEEKEEHVLENQIAA